LNYVHSLNLNEERPHFSRFLTFLLHLLLIYLLTELDSNEDLSKFAIENLPERYKQRCQKRRMKKLSQKFLGRRRTCRGSRPRRDRTRATRPLSACLGVGRVERIGIVPGQGPTEVVDAGHESARSLLHDRAPKTSTCPIRATVFHSFFIGSANYFNYSSK